MGEEAGGGTGHLPNTALMWTPTGIVAGSGDFFFNLPRLILLKRAHEEEVRASEFLCVRKMKVPNGEVAPHPWVTGAQPPAVVREPGAPPGLPAQGPGPVYSVNAH